MKNGKLVKLLLVFILVTGVVSAVFMWGSVTKEKNNKPINIDPETIELVQLNEPKEGDPIAIVDTTLGEYRFVLYPDRSPNAVKNFTELAEKGYYEYRLSAYYNPSTQHIVVENVNADGGRVYLTGRISSTGSIYNNTGSGRIVCLDGVSDITVDNQTNHEIKSGFSQYDFFSSKYVELSDYKNYHVEKEYIEVTDEDINFVIDTDLAYYECYKPIEKKFTEYGDIILMNISESNNANISQQEYYTIGSNDFGSDFD